MIRLAYFRSIYRASLIMVLFALALTVACTSRLPQPRTNTPPSDNTPWVHPEDSSVILGNRWRVIEALHDNQPIAYASLDPILLSFEATHVTVQPAHCNILRARLVPDGVRTFQWQETLSTAQGCLAIEEVQQLALNSAFLTTTSYVVNSTQLVLSGGNVRIMLVVDNTPPTPLPPSVPTSTSYPVP